MTLLIPWRLVGACFMLWFTYKFAHYGYWKDAVWMLFWLGWFNAYSNIDNAS